MKVADKALAEQERLLARQQQNQKITADAIPLQQVRLELEAALQAGTEITEDMILQGLATLQLSTLEAKAELTHALVRSLASEPPVSLKRIMHLLKTQRPSEQLEISTTVIAGFLETRGMEALEKVMSRDGITKQDVFEALCANMTEAEATTTLTKHNLQFLQPPPRSLLAAMQTALTQGSLGLELVRLVDCTVGEAGTGAGCAQLVLTAALEAVFNASQAAPNVDRLDDYVPALERVTRGDQKAQTEVLFQVQDKWFQAGKAKHVGKALFVKLCDTGVVSACALQAWREDTEHKQVGGKAPLILQMGVWLNEMEQKLREQEESGCEDDENEEQVLSVCDFF